MKLTHQNLPPRTGEALVCAAQGMSIKATARAMGCGIGTVESLRSNAMYKLHAQNITQAVSEAYRRGVLTYLAIVLCFMTIVGNPTQQRPSRAPVRPVAAVRVSSRDATA